jgi:hypothetical protein
MPPDARAVTTGRGHRFAPYPRCSTDVWEVGVFGIGRRRKPTAAEPTPACAFCKSSQEQVLKLIAGPTVFICDNCVRVCVDILASDARSEQRAGEQPSDGVPIVGGAPRWPSNVFCRVCQVPVVADEALAVEGRGVLCQACVSAVQAALAERDEPNGGPAT